MIFEVSAVRFSGFTPSFRISFYLNGLPAWGHAAAFGFKKFI